MQMKFELGRDFRAEGFPGGSAGKESAYNAGDPGSVPGSGRPPGEGSGLPIAVFWPGAFCGQRSLAGYSLWGRKELDMTERISLHTSERKDLPRPECSSCLNSIHLIMPVFSSLASLSAGKLANPVLAQVTLRCLIHSMSYSAVWKVSSLCAILGQV